MADFKLGDEVQHRFRRGERYQVLLGPVHNDVSGDTGYVLQNTCTNGVMWGSADAVAPVPPPTITVELTKAQAGFVAACFGECAPGTFMEDEPVRQALKDFAPHAAFAAWGDISASDDTVQKMRQRAEDAS